MSKKFIFRSHQTIGAAEAESDENYLKNCFIDTGDLEVLRDCRDPKHILVGRTGAGKSALLYRLCEFEDSVIILRPETIALSYIANSNILKFFAEAGVKLDIFFRYLWRHILILEVIKNSQKIYSEDKKGGFLTLLILKYRKRNPP